MGTQGPAGHRGLAFTGCAALGWFLASLCLRDDTRACFRGLHGAKKHLHRRSPEKLCPAHRAAQRVLTCCFGLVGQTRGGGGVLLRCPPSRWWGRRLGHPKVVQPGLEPSLQRSRSRPSQP